MWLYIFVVPLAIIMLIGGLLAGGVFTIVFLPLALIIVAAAVVFAMWGKSQQRPSLPSDRATTAPETGTGQSSLAPRPNTPDELVDARRQAQ
jgi:hypothetical protein